VAVDAVQTVAIDGLPDEVLKAGTLLVGSPDDHGSQIAFRGDDLVVVSILTAIQELQLLRGLFFRLQLGSNHH